MVVDAGEVGMGGIGGHGHNDVLSFDLWAAGAPLLVDSGTYTYTADPAARQAMRSTAAHNALRIAGQETSRLAGDRWLWQIANDAHPHVLEWTSTPTFDRLTAEHDGYARLPDPVIHRRSITFDKTQHVWRIVDALRGNGEHLVELFFHPAAAPLLEALAVRIQAPRGDLLLYPPAGLTLRQEPGWISRGYGHREPATVLVYSNRVTLPAEFATVLVLAEPDTPAEQARSEVERG